MEKYYEAKGLKYHFGLYDRGGSVVTNLLLNSLELGFIKGAWVVSDKKRFYADTAEGILTCRGSKYKHYPMPSLIDSEDAVVGLSCDFRGNEEYLKIGLFTGLCPSYKAYSYLYDVLRIEESKVNKHKFRQIVNGNMVNSIHLKDDRVIKYPTAWWTKIAYTKKVSYLVSKKCLKCTDNLNKNSDISVGDMRVGWSAVITRTTRGDEIFNSSIDNKYIEAVEITEDEFFTKKSSSRSFNQKERLGGFINCKKEFNEGDFEEFLKDEDRGFSHEG